MVPVGLVSLRFRDFPYCPEKKNIRLPVALNRKGLDLARSSHDG